MASPLPRDSARLVRVLHLPDIELLSANYVSHSFAKHTHETYAFGVVHRGVGQYVCEGRRYVVKTGDLILINPGDLHDGGAGSRAGVSYRTCYVSPQRLRHVCEAWNTNQDSLPYFPKQAATDVDSSRLISRLLDCLEESASVLEHEERLYSVLNRLITTFCKGINRRLHVAPCPSAVAQARATLEDRYADHIPLMELAGLVQLSPYHFLRLFRASVGLPPHAYQTQVRIDKAKAMLAHGAPIASVAAQTGFVDQSHLSRAFKRVVGVSPGNYRAAVSHSCLTTAQIAGEQQ
jgi:AraC-like DNA-binding protein